MIDQFTSMLGGGGGGAGGNDKATSSASSSTSGNQFGNRGDSAGGGLNLVVIGALAFVALVFGVILLSKKG